ncbi:MAG TPA: cysteine--tRNA ligase [Candidatus Kapabacteria bacterium]|nr:cysteine--tRNA ligase [Candidatus Kapabacteria bacterium]
MSLRIYNTLSRTKEEFQPIDPNLIRMYRCGPTVYKHMHIGHAKSYISTDVVRRYLMHVYGAEHLIFVMNITDVGHLADDADEGEDKMEAQARRENRSPFEIAAYYEASWLEDLDRMNVLRPDRMPHATDFIRQQITTAELLLERGLAYVSNGSVYFDVAGYQQRELPEGFVPYGGLSNRRSEDQQYGGRIAENQEKRAPQDFALWKKAEPEHFMQWYSPWGWGYPGWHLECSVMARYYLGTTFDIHAGGLDNMFPHHECEIAQSQGAYDAPFVHYWMHVNMVRVNDAKMGGSAGNALNMKDLYKRYDPLALRFFILQSHYRSTLEFSLEAIEAAASGLDKLRKAIVRLRKVLLSVPANGAMHEQPAFLSAFTDAMDDDFNTPVGLGALFEGVGQLNRMLESDDRDLGMLHAFADAFKLAFDDILGLDLFSRELEGEGEIAGDLMEIMIGLRQEARARKDFATSDAIRDRLKAVGVVLEDTKEGTRWVME